MEPTTPVQTAQIATQSPISTQYLLPLPVGGSPSIPYEYIRSIVVPLYASSGGECSNRTFRNILAAIENFSVLPGVREVIIWQIVESLSSICQQVAKELDQLQQTIQKCVLALTPDAGENEEILSETAIGKQKVKDSSSSELEVISVTMELFSPANSTQAKLLRLMKTLDFIYSKRRSGGSKPPSLIPMKRTWRGSPASSDDILSDLEEATSHQSQSRSQPHLSSSQTPQQTEPTPSSSSSSAFASSNAAAANSKTTEDIALSTLWRQPQYETLWRSVSACLSLAQNNPQLQFIPSVLLPIIECIMVVCKYRMISASFAGTSGYAFSQSSPAVTTLTKSPSQFQLTSSTMQPAIQQDDLFFSFTDKHRKALNSLVRKNPKLLRGPFALLVRNPKVLEFDNKRNYFNQQLHKKPANYRSAVKYVNVRRQYIFQDSYYQLSNYSGEELRFGKLSIKFSEEEGADYGGVLREWYQELTKEMFNPNYALFTTSAEKTGITYQPNPTSWVNPSHLLYFKFVGRVIGKAIYDGKLLDAYFTRSLYKHILGKPVDVSDMEAIDPEYHKSLVWMTDNDITDILDLTFSMEIDEFGQQKVIDLLPDGRNIPVTNDNKHEYVKLVVEHRLTKTIRDQLTAFLSGFYEIIPKDLVTIFSEKELELLISGVPDIDVDDWKNNTEYRGYTSSSPQVQWFWRAIRSFDQEERAKLLQFSTGTSKVPLEGFAKLQGSGGLQRFQIHKDFGSTDRLPSAHTCFNQVDIPVYESYEQLRERLYFSITEATTGFGFE